MTSCVAEEKKLRIIKWELRDVLEICSDEEEMGSLTMKKELLCVKSPLLLLDKGGFQEIVLNN